MAANWNDWNSQEPPRRRTVRLRGWSERVSRALMKLADWPEPAKLAFALTLIVLAVSLAGCATTSAPSSEPARNPSPPPTTLSESSETFSSRALRNISEWRKKLIELLPRPAN